ncbi:MAG: ornithine cyclodeaminase family protein [Thermoleophilia bacterium]|nr:ornithine cyclodeaminase family protein [Thermoleophilia bacterium]
MTPTPLDLLLLSGEDVTAVALSDDDVLAAVETAVRAQGEGRVVLDPRVHHVPDPALAGHFNLLRATVWPLDTTGVKVVGDFARNYERGLPSELALVTLYDPRTGVPTAIVDATEITERRTGALTALGGRELGRPGSRVLAHLGARGTAFSNVTMLDRLFDFDEIRVTSRRAESRDAFGEALTRALGKPIVVTDTIEGAVTGADVVVEATRLEHPEPLLRTAWLDACSLLIPYGTMSVLEPDVLDDFDKVVVDDWGQCGRDDGFGALRPHVRAGLLTEQTLHAELGEIVAGARPGRESADESILFWHRGLATTDVAVAHLIVSRARERGLGTTFRYRS